MTSTRIVIFAKAPVAGLAKTRLAPALGAEGAARLAAHMLAFAIDQALAVPGVEVELCVAPGPTDPAWQGWRFPANLQVVAQGDGDLGERLARAADRAFATGVRPVFIGTDCPALDTVRLRDAVEMLSIHDAFIHGTEDGGYALLGLARSVPSVFTDIPWSTAAVFGLTMSRLSQAGLSVGVGDQLVDVDEPETLRHVPAKWMEAVCHADK